MKVDKLFSVNKLGNSLKNYGFEMLKLAEAFHFCIFMPNGIAIKGFSILH